MQQHTKQLMQAANQTTTDVTSSRPDNISPAIRSIENMACVTNSNVSLQARSEAAKAPTNPPASLKVRLALP
jgi:hypothetical protein